MTVTVRLLRDPDHQALSLWAPPGAPGNPVPHVLVRLLGPSRRTTAVTDEGGVARLEGLEPGERGVLEVELDSGQLLTSHAVSGRLAAAIRRGEGRMVVLGDSIPVFGPKPTFPERLDAMLRPLVPWRHDNLAISGVESARWLPDGATYRSQARPVLPGADLVVVSLGGNDLTHHAFRAIGGRSAAMNPVALMAEVHQVIGGVKANLVALFDQIGRDAPGADLAWIVYPNYARSARWRALSKGWSEALAGILDTILDDVRAHLARRPGLLLVDLHGRLGRADISPYLSDPLHLGAEGHQLWAEALFATVGGVADGEKRTLYVAEQG